MRQPGDAHQSSGLQGLRWVRMPAAGSPRWALLLALPIGLLGLLVTCQGPLWPLGTSLEPGQAEPTPGRASSTASPGARETAGGLDPLHPEDRFQLAEARELAGWTVQLWQRLPGADGAAAGWGGLATIEGPGPSPPPVAGAIEIDPQSGRDLDGDGRPEVVIRSWTGGAHCCESILALRLGPQRAEPILHTPPSNCPAQFEDLDGDGRAELLTCDDAFAYRFCAFAASPLPQVVLRFDPGQGAYVPATPDFADRLERPDGDPPSSGLEADAPYLRCAALAPALFDLYTGQDQAGWQAVDALAARTDAPGLRSQIEEILSGSNYYRAPGAPAKPVLAVR